MTYEHCIGYLAALALICLCILIFTTHAKYQRKKFLECFGEKPPRNDEDRAKMVEKVKLILSCLRTEYEVAIDMHDAATATLVEPLTESEEVANDAEAAYCRMWISRERFRKACKLATRFKFTEAVTACDGDGDF